MTKINRQNNQFSFDELGSMLSDGLMRVATRPDANSYQPHVKQVEFHKSPAKQRLYIGGNRSGKTVAGVVEDIWWLTGRHPYRATPSPHLVGGVRGRLVCVDYPNGWSKIVEPVVRQWLPPSSLINGSWDDSWNERKKRLTLANGSFLEIMNYEQGLDAFAGASRHFTHFDEEPPSAIYTECRARLVDTGGSSWITMTPVEGMTWVYDKLYEPHVVHGLINRAKLDVIEVDMTDNVHLGKEEITDFLAGMDETEKQARKSGKFVQMGGLIYRDFDPSKHVIPSLDSGIPYGWRIIASLDHGMNHPTAWMFHTVSPDNRVITFAEHHKADLTIKQHVKAVNEIRRKFGLLQRDILWVGDPSIKQRTAVTGNSIQLEYQQLGISIKTANNDVKAGIARVKGYLRSGRWFVTEDCPKLLWELRRYRWKTRESRKLQEKHGAYDEPHKKDDDAVDSCRYGFMSLPKLAPEPLQVKYEPIRRQLTAMLNAKDSHNVLAPPTGLQLDPSINFFKVGRGAGSEFDSEFTIDEHMGGNW